MDDCEHNYQYLGLQWWNDGEPRPGSGATTIRYVHTFFCSKCAETTVRDAALSHGSYEHTRPGSTPILAGDIRKARQCR